MGVSREKEGEREEKWESGLKKGAYYRVGGGGRRSGGVWKILPISTWK